VLPRVAAVVADRAFGNNENRVCIIRA
jgi:hypothetical protein